MAAPRVFSKILVAFDGSPLSRRALGIGAQLANTLGSELGIVSVVDPGEAVVAVGGIRPGELMAEMRNEAEKKVRSEAERLPEGKQPREFIREGSTPAEIVAAADEWGAELIVVGSERHSRLETLLFGSTAESVMRRSSLPVLLVRPQSGRTGVEQRQLS